MQNTETLDQYRSNAEKSAGSNVFWPFIIFLACFFVIWILRATYLYSIDLTFSEGLTRRIYSEMVKAVLWVTPVFIFLRSERQRPLAYLGLKTRPKGEHILLPSIVLATYFVFTIIYEAIVNGRHINFSLGFAGAAVTLVSVSVSPVSEEVLFRGFVLRKLWSRIPFSWANVVTSLLFAAVHLPNWLWVNGFQSWIITRLSAIFVLSLVLGWLVKRGDSLYPAIVGHILNNLIAAMLTP